jgi:3'-phosphoadenosine 5'-phosphosulfate sulfotransferase (PAPS reductase)/FAD synthetase
LSVIVALSGGLASGYCAHLALSRHPKEDVVLYFNDTKWEHPDLYRFLDDLAKAFNHPITRDDDGRSVDDLCFDMRALPNNRMPFCSRVLKAERLKHFFQNGDTIVFGIGPDEAHRAQRIAESYYEFGKRKGKWAKLLFPLIAERVSKEEILSFYGRMGIDIPLLYKLGFKHNNCSGGCVRSGKKQWLHLLRVLPDIYRMREETENLVSSHLGKPVTFLKDMSLKALREKATAQMDLQWSLDDDETVSECIGVCSSAN